MIGRLQLALKAVAARRGVRLERAPRELLLHPDRLLPVGFEHVVARHLLDKADPAQVFFIQIGAFDGSSGDPLYRHVRRHGWQGVLVEPQERYFRALEAAYRDCPGLTLLNVAVAPEAGERTLYTIADPDDPDLPPWAPQIASFSRRTVLAHRREIPDLERRIAERPVPCMAMAELLALAPSERPIDLLQIDVEGYDLALLEAIDFGRWRPTIVRFEHKHLDRQDQDRAIRLLAAQGYRFVRERDDTTAYRPAEAG